MTVQEWLGTENQLGQDIWERKYRYENETFDKIGYLKENDNIWFNIGVNNSLNYVPIIEFVMGRMEE